VEESGQEGRRRWPKIYYPHMIAYPISYFNHSAVAVSRGKFLDRKPHQSGSRIILCENGSDGHAPAPGIHDKTITFLKFLSLLLFSLAHTHTSICTYTFLLPDQFCFGMSNHIHLSLPSSLITFRLSNPLSLSSIDQLILLK